MMIEYPVIRVRECKHFDPYFSMVGVRYCPKCNTIILFGAVLIKDIIEEKIERIIEHESIHWLLCNLISEDASLGFDELGGDMNEKNPAI